MNTMTSSSLVHYIPQFSQEKLIEGPELPRNLIELIKKKKENTLII